ncbi:hypothetical protein [Yoonia vestfoldensis]|nr:hypothetical protein [Yoonia vestfoldensis]
MMHRQAEYIREMRSEYNDKAVIVEILPGFGGLALPARSDMIRGQL